MKIVHYINNLGSGGAEKLLTDILPIMYEKGHEIDLIITNDYKNIDRFQNTITSSNVNIYNLNYSFYNPLQVLKLIRILKKNKYDIAHAHLFPSQYWLAIASFFISKKTKLIKTEHSVYNERKSIKILKYLEVFIYSRYTKIIAITDLVKQNLDSWINQNAKTIVINNGVNLTQISNQQKSIPDSNYNFINTKCFNILMVGRFDNFNQKDQTTLINALKLLPNDCMLYFAGEGSNLENVRKTVNDLQLDNQVFFLGVRNDIYKLMSVVNINVLSTNHEGLSGVALEGLASGKPFIGTDVVGVNDVVPNNDFLFPKKNPQELANKIIIIKNSLLIQEKLIVQAINHVKNYDIEIMVDKYLNLYKTTITK